MNVKTYRAKTMQEALALVRSELGAKASVLHTREVRPRGLRRWMGAACQIEVVASANVSVPSRLPARAAAARAVPHDLAGLDLDRAGEMFATSQSFVGATAFPSDGRPATQREVRPVRTQPDTRGELPQTLFRLFADLIEADIPDDLARTLIERIRRQMPDAEQLGLVELKRKLARLVEADLPATGAIQLTPGRRRLVALVGPTGVGKTTTIAKLAANFRLRDKRRIGLITVDTYRIAAVEQLRTYADIIDLPMEIVATPREMQQAVARMSDLDLILLDTAGRSPRDEVQIQELKNLLAEAVPDEVHLVLSSVASTNTLARTVAQFSAVGTTALVLTKLDEAPALGNLLPLLQGSRLPLSYLTHGQNVPDDITPADGRRLALAMLGFEPLASQAA
jgi:flagellar biosynthesis protein FlhF